MPPAATRPPIASTLYLAFELGNSEWKLAMTTSIDRAPLLRTIPARALKTLETEIERARVHFGLPATAEAQSCYEAGRDGFWLHRYLVSRSIGNSIVDSSSIEVISRTSCSAFRAFTNILRVSANISGLRRVRPEDPRARR